MMSMVGAVSKNVNAPFDVQVHRWVPFSGAALRFRTKAGGEGNEPRVTLLASRDSPSAALSRFEPVASGRLRLGAAQKEHVTRRTLVHPSAVTIESGGTRVAKRPLRRYPLQLARVGDNVWVVEAGPPMLDLSAVCAYWRNYFGVGKWPVEDLYYGLAEPIVGDVVLSDPTAFARAQGRSCIYLASHQVGVESLLFSSWTSALSTSIRDVAHLHWQQYRGCRDVFEPRRPEKSRRGSQGNAGGRASRSTARQCRCPFTVAWRAGKTPIWPQRTARRRSQVVTI